MIKNNKIYLGFILLLAWIVIDSILKENYIITIMGTVGIGLITFQIRVNEDVRIVIVKNKIHRKFKRKALQNYYIIFLEITNLSTYSQFYNIKLSDHIINQTFQLLHKRLRNNVFLYSANQLVIINEFENKTVINQRLRNEEQEEKTQRITRYLNNQKIYFDRKDQYYQIQVQAGTGSVGIRGDYNTIDEMIKLAHFAMLKGKEEGKNIVVADEEIRIIKDDVDIFNQELEKGLEYDEIVPHFLPIINPHTMKVIGCESLLRWEKSEYRIIEAQKFKRVAEEKNLFELLDSTIIKKTFQAYRGWIKDDLVDSNFSITLNLGLKTLESIHAQELIVLAQEYDIPLENIEIDISEHDMSNNHSIDMINKLKEAGFRVAVDALSANNTLIHTLSNISVDTIKLDRALLPSDEDDSNRYQFYRAIVKMSKILGYNVMAKGVENKPQLSLAKNLQVDLIQGYYITPPLNDMKVRGFLNKYHRNILA